MAETVRVTTTGDVVLRHAFELASTGSVEEDRWERQERGLQEIGYTIVGRDELVRLRGIEQRARELAPDSTIEGPIRRHILGDNND